MEVTHDLRDCRDAEQLAETVVAVLAISPGRFGCAGSRRTPKSLPGSWWISDDQKALRYARLQGIITRETIDLVNIAVGNGGIGARDGFDLMQQMALQGRCLRLPNSAADLLR